MAKVAAFQNVHTIIDFHLSSVAALRAAALVSSVQQSVPYAHYIRTPLYALSNDDKVSRCAQ